MAKKVTTSAVEINRRRYAKDPIRLASVLEERKKLKLADKIYKIRQEMGLTQKELADRIGTAQSAISRLENADYERCNLNTLVKLSVAFNRRLDVDFR